MNSIEINETNWFARYHKFIYGSLPDNFCAFFWKLLAAIIFFPFVVPSEIQNNYFTEERSDRNFVAKIIVSLIIYFVIFLLTGLGGSTLEEIWSKEIVHGWDLGGWLILLSLAVGLLLAFGVIVCVVLGLGLCSYVHEQIRHRKYVRKMTKKGKPMPPKGPSQVRLMFDNIRSKYCTKIVWKSNASEME